MGGLTLKRSAHIFLWIVTFPFFKGEALSPTQVMNTNLTLLESPPPSVLFNRRKPKRITVSVHCGCGTREIEV